MEVVCELVFKKGDEVGNMAGLPEPLPLLDANYNHQYSGVEENDGFFMFKIHINTIGYWGSPVFLS